MIEASTAPTQEGPSTAEANWLAWLDNPSPDDLAWIAQKEARDRRVGALLHDMHYLATSKPPQLVMGESEESYWTGYARNCPGFDETRVQAELTRRKTAF